MSATNTALAKAIARNIFTLIWILAAITVSYFVLKESFTIRLYAIKEYGLVIHEFDPYFNFRATEYLYENGWKAFTEWFDYKVWYPLGRPVGTTIYPGMQVTAVAIKNFIMGGNMSLNDICCYIPAWFGTLATLFTGLLTYECCLPSVGSAKCQIVEGPGQSNSIQERNLEAPFSSIFEYIPIVRVVYSKIILPILYAFIHLVETLFGTDFGMRQCEPLRNKNSLRKNAKISQVDLSSPAVECGIFAAMIMAVVPAHLMRSIGGGFDNESVAMTAMTSTFYLWTRSLRGVKTAPITPAILWGILTGIAYFNMVAAWGGYIFVINLIGCHAAILVLFGRYSSKLHSAYSAFYIVGTALAIQVPVVGWTPLKSLEQLGPCAVFCALQLLEFAEWQKRRKGLSKAQTWKLRFIVFGGTALVGGMVVYCLAPSGYFGPLSARVRGLFVKHTKTGNPLVDSVAEHQPASSDAYFTYLNNIVYIAPLGFAMTALRYCHDSSSFLLVYGVAAYFFSNKMVRLILLTAPIASAFGGIFIGRVFGWALYNLVDYTPNFMDFLSEEDKVLDEVKKSNNKKKKSNSKGGTKEEESKETANSIIQYALSKSLVFGIALFAVRLLISEATLFHEKSHAMAKAMSHPTIIMKGTLKDGSAVTVDDYREAYWWIRDNTPEDSRIMAWWDYGYQITAIANRTTIADGNTWNHEHIALLGRALTSPEKEGHRIARHLADYVLVWAGGGGDDLAKSPHLARIANSVYRHMCPGDPTCSRFGVTRDGRPSEMMQNSFLFKLHSHGRGNVVADPNRFREVFQSKFGKVRIFKLLSVSAESKAWAADPSNRICDVPGGWFCRGQYPPALQKVLKEKKDFSQLEDFNRKGDDDSEYQKKYFENLNQKQQLKMKNYESEKKEESQPKRKIWTPSRTVTQEEIKALNNKWEDSPTTTMLWEMISGYEVKELLEWLTDSPESAFARSSDGRGPMWWAHEHGHDKIVKILKKVGVSETLRDKDGIRPIDMSRKSEL